MNTVPTPSPARDAAERAFRTLMQGLLFDLLTAVVVAVTAGIAGGITWTRAYWVALALAVAKSAVTAIFSYIARQMVPPSSSQGAR